MSNISNITNHQHNVITFLNIKRDTNYFSVIYDPQFHTFMNLEDKNSKDDFPCIRTLPTKMTENYSVIQQASNRCLLAPKTNIFKKKGDEKANLNI